MKTALTLPLLALYLVVGTAFAAGVAMGTDWLATRVNEDQFSINKGSKLFQAKCSGCHAVDAGANSRFGPNLHDIGEVAASRIPGMNSAEYILNSILHPTAYSAFEGSGYMPGGTVTGMRAAQVRNIVFYLTTRGTEHRVKSMVNSLNIDETLFSADESDRTLATTSAQLAQLRKGEKLFMTELQCAACHSIFNNPGSALFAPSLAHAHKLQPDYIRQSVRSPSEIISSGYQQIELTLRDGSLRTGQLIAETEDATTLLLRDKTNAPTQIKIKKSEISKRNLISVSTMPAYPLSDENMDALVAFLTFLDGEIPEP